MNYVSVIVTFNRKELLKQAIESLLNQTLLPQKVIVIDNNSTDGTQEMITKLYSNNSLVKYCHLSQNNGGSAGFYAGLKKALKEEDADWISLSDDDAIYAEDYFEKLSQAHFDHPDVKVLSGTVLNGNHQIETLHRRRIKNWNILSDYEVPVEEYQTNFFYDLFTFVGVVISKEIIKQVGLPQKDFFIWFDDSEYSLRVHKLTKVLNVSDAKVYHKVKAKSENNQWYPNWREYYGMRNRIQVIKKYGHPYLLTRAYFIALLARKLIGNTVKSERKGYRRFMYRLFWDGFRDGIKNNLGKNNNYLPSTKIVKKK